jgi:hypothetical protein
VQVRNGGIKERVDDRERIYFKTNVSGNLDIRIASYSQDSYTCFLLSDIFHNVPLQMNRVDKGEKSYADIITLIRKICEERNCISWLENANANIANLR